MLDSKAAPNRGGFIFTSINDARISLEEALGGAKSLVPTIAGFSRRERRWAIFAGKIEPPVPKVKFLIVSVILSWNGNYPPTYRKQLDRRWHLSFDRDRL
ncbi:MAG: hypothetical protein AAB594_01930 [Patescibacteria group bacterium]